MSTRATIEFSDEYETAYIYRHFDGFPKTVAADIDLVLNKAAGRWSGGEVGQLIALFFAIHGDPDKRLQKYELTSSFHGDESYRYYCRYDAHDKIWVRTEAEG